jgi:RNA polymerase sigma-70 factor (ECF subfamily)
MAGEPHLDELYRLAMAAHPRISVTGEAYVSFVVARLDEEVPSEAVAADLLLACGCANGDSEALAAFEAGYVSQVASFIARVDASPAIVDEVKQRLRERLLVDDGLKRPRIGDYGGRGRLASWVRVAAIRIALDMKARGGMHVDEAAADALFVEDDPELDYLRVRYREQFQNAFVEALATLDPRDRLLLKLNLIDGLNIERIGRMHGVHRATVARWIAAAREQLFERTRDSLHRELGVSATEFASLVRLVRSQLDVSLCRLLGDQAAPS